MKDKILSKNFRLSEFNYIKPEKDLLYLLQILRNETSVIHIANSARTVKQHIGIYKKIYGDKWEDKIPWSSRHLPAFGCDLRAVDFNIKLNNKLMYGAEIYELIKQIAKDKQINVGLGIGLNFLHLDVRKNNVEWEYKY